MSITGPERQPLETPRAAGLAGVVFALLFAAAIILIQLGIPQGAGAVTAEGWGTGRFRMCRSVHGGAGACTGSGFSAHTSHGGH
ncbi:hypothetical protein [Streptomyces sp. CA-106131]|uniref:hypothetical protein n=1 Tax=Streptomyces sp. CA-106131 TaxID=3240045 RepID=UPI003D8EDD98